MTGILGRCRAVRGGGKVWRDHDGRRCAFVGCAGAAGRGTIDHFGMQWRVDIQVGTLSKAIGALGGYVCGTRDLVDFLYHRRGRFCFRRRILRRWRRLALRRSMFWKASRSGWSSFGRTRVSGKRTWAARVHIGGQTTPASETRLLRSLLARDG